MTAGLRRQRHQIRRWQILLVDQTTGGTLNNQGLSQYVGDIRVVPTSRHGLRLQGRSRGGYDPHEQTVGGIIDHGVPVDVGSHPRVVGREGSVLLVEGRMEIGFPETVGVGRQGRVRA